MFFDEVLEGKPDPIFGLTGAFKADVRPEKVNLLVGIYKDEDLRAPLMPSVKRAKEIVSEQDEVADYLPFEGLTSFTEQIGALIFGKSTWLAEHGRIFGAQSIGGTGALRLAAEFFAQEVSKIVALSNPTWPNHRGVFERAGFKVETYDYYLPEVHGFDLEAMSRSLEGLPEKSVVVFHAACHNPTGCDPTMNEWEHISDLIKRKNLVPFFDFAYQGFGDGIEKDAAAVRLFLERGHEMLVAYSCSKNFSLYCQRVGALFAVTNHPASKLRVGSQIKRSIRTFYSNPPAFGAKIVAEVLKDPDLRIQWEEELTEMRRRLTTARDGLVQRLLSKARKVDFTYLKGHKGMFSFVDLDKSQVQQLIDQFAIYLIDNGRISVAGLTPKNTEYVADAILAVSDL